MAHPREHHGFVKGEEAWSPAPRTEHAGSGPLKLGILVVIAVGGTMLVCVAVGFAFLWMSRRRSRKEQEKYVDGITEPATEEEVASRREKQGRRKKLRKRHSPPETREEDDDGYPAARYSIIRRISLPVLPPLFSSRTSFNPFNAPSDVNNGSNHRRTSTWIDEDALHGPKMRRKKKESKRESRQKSIRESWPLRSMVPTLPKLQQGHLPLHQRQQQELMAAHALSQPPRPVLLLSPQRQSAQMPPGKAYSFGDLQRQGQNLSPTRKGGYTVCRPETARLRTSSTESTLSQILLLTERRLQESGTTGVARRNRLSASPPKTAAAAAASRETLASSADGSTTLLCAPSSPTPSPVKSSSSPTRAGSSAGSGHARQESLASALSEDSIFARNPSPVNEVQTALSSPSRGKPRERDVRPQSPASSVSSALSTLYSVDEGQEATEETSLQSSRVHDDGDRAAAAAAVAAPLQHDGSDPFFSTSPPKPRVHWLVRQDSPTIPIALNRPPRLRRAAQEEATPPRSGGEDTSPLSSIFGSGQKGLDSSPPFENRRDIGSPEGWSNNIRLSQIYPPPLRIPSSSDSVRHKVSPSPRHTGRPPAVLITSPSTASVLSTPPTISALTSSTPTGVYGQESWARRAFPPPHILHAPSAARDDDEAPAWTVAEEDTMPPLPGSPELELIRPQGGVGGSPSVRGRRDGDDDISPILSRMPGRRKARAASTASSDYGPPAGAVDESPTPGGGGARATVSRAAKPSSIPVAAHKPAPAPSSSRGLQVAATVAELRRMNSSVTACSDASDATAVDNSAAGYRSGRHSPTKNYLALGRNSGNGSPSRGWRGPATSSAKGCEKENEDGKKGDSSLELVMPRPELGEPEGRNLGSPGTTTMIMTPSKPRWSGEKASRRLWGVVGVGGEQQQASPDRWSDRWSDDSLGLYDRDGFLRSSPLRG